MSNNPTFANETIVGYISEITGSDDTRGQNLSGPNVHTVLTAGPNGAMLTFIRICPLGNNGNNVLRVFLNNGGPLDDSSNNALIGEVQIPSSTASNTTAQYISSYALGFPIPADNRLLVAFGDSSINEGYSVFGLGANF